MLEASSPPTTPRKKKVSLPSSSAIALSEPNETKRNDKKKKKAKEKKKSSDDIAPLKNPKQNDKASRGTKTSKKSAPLVMTAPAGVTEYLHDIFQTAFESCPKEKQISSAIKRVEVRFYMKTETGKLTGQENTGIDDVHNDPVGRPGKDRKKSKKQEPKKKKKTKKKEKHRTCNPTKEESLAKGANISFTIDDIQPTDQEDHCNATMTSFPYGSVNRLIGTSVVFAKPFDHIPIDITISQVGQGIYSTFGPGTRNEEFEPTNSPLVVVPGGERMVLSGSPKSPRVPIDLNDEATSISAPSRRETFSNMDMDTGMISENSKDEPAHMKRFNWILQKKIGRPWYVRSFSAGDKVSLLADYDQHQEFGTMNEHSVNRTSLSRSPVMHGLTVMGSMVDGHDKDAQDGIDFRKDKVIEMPSRAILTIHNSSSLVADGNELNADQKQEGKANQTESSNRHKESPLKQQGYTLEHILSSSGKQTEADGRFEI